jgi:hypothetical protein
MFAKNKDGKIVSSKMENIDDILDDNKPTSKITKVRERKFSLPKQMMIGFYSNIKKSDLKNYLLAKANSHMLPDNTYFGIKKYENGYLWELQEGGSGKGILSSLIETLKTQDDIIIETSDKNVRVLKKSVGDGISSFSLNGDDIVTPTESIVFKDKLKAVKTTGYGFFVVSTIFGFMGILAATGLLIFKFGLFHQPKPLKFVIEDEALPVSQMDAINGVMRDPQSYLYKLTYNKVSAWSMSVKQEAPQEKKESNIDKELSKQLEDLKKKLNLEVPTEEGDSNE